MKSKISISLNDNNEPVISIKWRGSDDLQDVLIKKFIEGFGSFSSLATFTIIEGPEDQKLEAIITPIGVKEYNEILQINRTAPAPELPVNE